MRRAGALKALALAAASLVSVPGATLSCAAEEDVPAIGLMGTIPVFWGESDGIGELLAGEGQGHWARPVLERHGPLVPLARLDGGALDPLRYLVLVQPRGLAPAENVALDAWVRGGGTLLLFADPMMTGESRFAIGDRRRPQDVILLSPILRHWGLELLFDADQPVGMQMREFAGKPFPVNLAGHFGPPAAGSGCALELAGILASCAIGAGRVIILADAAVLDLHDPDPVATPALEALLARSMPAARETAGRSGTKRGTILESGTYASSAAPEEPPD